METSEQIERFQEFFENYKEQLQEIARLGLGSILIDFSELTKSDLELSEILLSNPEDVLKAAELALTNFDISAENIRVRFFNLPKAQHLMIRDIRSIHLGKFISLEGIVRQTSDVRPQVTSAKFECPSCGNAITILQIESKFKEPSRCSCGRHGRFRLISKELVDAQRIILEESPESLEGGEQPKRLAIFLKEDLVEPKMEKKTTPGSKVCVTGIIKEVVVPLRTGGQSTRFDLVMETNSIQPIEVTFEDIKITKKDEEEIKALAKDKRIYEKLIASIAPSIYGHEEIKGAIILQLMGGVTKERGDGTKSRGYIHVLLVGDPGTSKSTILSSVSKIAPKSRLTSGKSATGAGLCVAPDSLVLTNPGGIHKIKNIVEENLKNYEKPYCRGVWNSSNPRSNKKIFTLDCNLKLKSKSINQFWRISPPDYMLKIKTRTGKEIITTPNTRLYDSNLFWKEASKFKEGDIIATIRKLKGSNKEKILIADLIKSNPVILGIKDKVKFIIEEACRKRNITKRSLAKNLKISELSIYYNWVNQKARGNIKLNSLKLLAKYANIPLTEIIEENIKFSLYNGHPINLPKYVDKKLLYFAGLIAGDGDVYKRKNSVTIRFSNSSKYLMDSYIKLSKELFDVKPSISSKKSEKRPESWRFSSKLVFEILESLGIPHSPKSHRLDMSDILLKIPNKLLSYYLKGYYDTDGGCVERKKGSSHIESISTSKIFSEKLKLILLRYGIITKIRKRKPCPNKKIKSKYIRFVISVSGKENLEKFKKFINFNHPEKKLKLGRIINNISITHTNIDSIPNARILIKDMEKDLKIKLMKRKDKHGISRNYLLNIIKNIKKYQHKNTKILNLLVYSDILWDKITNVEIIRNHDYKFVYDLTVKSSHNFVINGILVHNTAVVVRDEFLRGWALEAGAMVLASGGYLFIDELDKMSPEDRDALHEGLEQMRISIAKANIQATLTCETTVLSAANPKLGRFDPYSPIASQIDLPSTLINRFDLIFPIRDLPNKQVDSKIASRVLSSHQKPEEIKPQIPIDILKKYISYARQKTNPKLTDAALEEIKNFYVDLRNRPTIGDESVKPIPISARQLEALVRLSEGSARVRLSKKVTKEDAKRAISILKHCLMQVGFDYETGQIDIDRISTGVSSSERGKIISVRNIINELEAKVGKMIPIEDVVMEAKEKGIEEDKVNEAIEKLKRSGDLFSPKASFISRI